MVAEQKNIEVRQLYVYFPVRQGSVKAVDGVNLQLPAGKVTSIVGESGCGKSVLGQALLAALPQQARVEGEVSYLGKNLLTDVQTIPGFYGRVMGVVPQNPGDSLNPIRKIGKQFSDIVEAFGLKYDEEQINEYLRFFGLEDSRRVLESYPHELSGGMQQRVLCAMCLATRPEWVMADEPTKGLDEKSCEIVYMNLEKMKQELSMGMVIITHDYKLAERISDRVAVMYAGQILETSTELFKKPLHPYTQALLSALPENGFQALRGSAPEPGAELKGCVFADRCPEATERCHRAAPPVKSLEQAMVRCWKYA